jgi:hypothetical protein
MKNFKKAIFSRAFSVIRGTDYNQVAQEMREDDFALFYEVALPEEVSWEHLRDRIYPSLARYLKSKSMDPESGSGLVISVFHADHCYLIEGPSFIEVFLELEGLGRAAFKSQVAEWLSGSGKSEPKLLTG